MQFYFDESGSFSIPRNFLHHRAAVVMGVAISEVIANDLREEFARFVTGLDSSELEKGEPKGNLLSPRHREEFCDLLARHDRVSLTPVTLDLSSLAGQGYRSFPARMGQLLDERAPLFLSEEWKQRTSLAARQFRRLSVDQALRLFSLANCFRVALQHAILFLSSGRHERVWNEVGYTVDSVQRRPDSREEQVFASIILGWLAAWSFRHPFDLAKEIHTADNAFVKQYSSEHGISLNRLVDGKIRWRGSEASWGLQIADIAANIVFEAVRDLDDANGAVSRFASLMRSSSYGWKIGPGLFTPASDRYSDVETKYRLLGVAMAQKRDGGDDAPMPSADLPVL